jgi:hypothetical protein
MSFCILFLVIKIVKDFDKPVSPLPLKYNCVANYRVVDLLTKITKSDLKITMLYSTSLSVNKILLLHLTSASEQCRLSGTDPC